MTVELGIVESVLWARCYPGHTHNAADAGNAAVCKARVGRQGGKHASGSNALAADRMHTSSDAWHHRTPQGFLDSFPAMYAAPGAERVDPKGIVAALGEALAQQ